MKTKLGNEKGFMLIGLVMVIIVIFGILIYSIQNNMSLFFANFNHNKAYYDAEIAIDRLSVELKNAYDLGSTVDNSIPPLNAANLRLGKFYYEFDSMSLNGDKICVDRADGRFEPICLDFDNSSIQVQTISATVTTWSDRWEAFQWALLKLIHDLTAPSIAYAEEQGVFRPAIPLNAPQIPLTYILPTPEISELYGNFNCSPHPPNWLVQDCVTFRFCTKIAGGKCNPDEWVYQTVLFNRPPRTDLEN